MSKKKSRRKEERQGIKAHSHRDPKGEWSVRIIRAGSPTGPAYIDFRFPTQGGGFGQVQVPYSELRHPKRLLDRLADHLPVFPRNIEARDAAQADFINKLVKSNNSPIDIVPERTGFIDKDSFATFSEIVTRDGRRTPLRRIGHSNMDAPIDVRGTKEGTCRDVLELGLQSTYLAFALGVAFAACLPSYLSLYAESQEAGGVLTETAVFNFSGYSSSGKTSICLGAMSTAGSPQRAGTMNFSARGLSELAADSNDLPLVMDDTEKGEDEAAYMVRALKAIVHTVSGGRSKIISRGVDQSKFPQLRWRTMGLSSSPKSIRVLAAERNWEMTPGDMVRLFDIRVPGPEKGGIFDRIEGYKRRRARKSVELIAQLERGYTNNHGHIYPQWVTYLMTKEPVTSDQSGHK